MAYDEDLAERVRGLLADQDEMYERKMFGGLAFMVNGHMCCGVNQDTLMLRVGPEAHDRILALEHARPLSTFASVYPALRRVGAARQADEGVEQGRGCAA